VEDIYYCFPELSKLGIKPDEARILDLEYQSVWYTKASTNVFGKPSGK
jgi:hypothetical protein